MYDFLILLKAKYELLFKFKITRTFSQTYITLLRVLNLCSEVTNQQKRILKASSHNKETSKSHTIITYSQIF